MCSSAINAEWVMISRCSFHMIPNRSWFEEFQSMKEDFFLEITSQARLLVFEL